MCIIESYSEDGGNRAVEILFFDSSRPSRYKDSNFIEVNITQRL